MTEQRVYVPASLTEPRVLAFSKELRGVPRADRYVVDLTGLGHIEPFGMLLCASVLRRFVAERRAEGAQFCAVGHQQNSYAAHMAFYKAFGLQHGNEPGEAPGSQRYLPISKLAVRDLYLNAGYRPVGEAVEQEAERLARLLLQQDEGPTFLQVRYALLEMMRNVVEHSEGDEIWYAGQFWPTRDCVEIAILDEGVGVRRSLARNPKYRVGTDEEALRLALQRGVTGAVPSADAGRAADSDDVWQNAGYGLYLVSTLCAEKGTFSLLSGDACLSVTAAGQSSQGAAFSGTAVRMKLDTTSKENINAYVDRISPSPPGERRRKSRMPSGGV